MNAILPSALDGASLRHIQDDLLQLQKLAALGELAGGITHDFRNVLQTVLSTLELLEARCDDPAEVRRLTAGAMRAAERGIGLTKRILNFSRRQAAATDTVPLLPSLQTVTEMLS